MVGQAPPKSRAGVFTDCVRADTNDARAGATAGAASQAVAALLVRLTEEINPSLRPVHRSRAISKLACPTQPLFQVVKEMIELDEMV